MCAPTLQSIDIESQLQFLNPTSPDIHKLIYEVHWELVKLLAESDSIRSHFHKSSSGSRIDLEEEQQQDLEDEIYHKWVDQVRQLDAIRKWQLIDHVASILKNHGAKARSLEISICFLYNLWRLIPRATVGQEIARALEGIVSCS